MNAKLYIAVPVHNRKEIVRECLPTLVHGVEREDSVVIHNDGSKDIDRAFLSLWTDTPQDALIMHNEPIGIERQRRLHFELFWRAVLGGKGYTHLYLTDSDALHDPNWRSELLRLQAKYDDDPICGYNTDAHVRLAGNTQEDDPKEEVIVRRVAPGVSYLLTIEHVRKVMRYLSALPPDTPTWHWDWTVPAILGHRFLVTRRSVVDHIGMFGMHHPQYDGYDGGDRCLGPTEWLVKKRTQVVAKLSIP